MSAKIWHCARLIRSLAAPKILSLGKIKINFAFALDLFVSLHCYESIVQQYPDMVSSLHIGDVHNRHGVYTYRAVF